MTLRSEHETKIFPFVLIVLKRKNTIIIMPIRSFEHTLPKKTHSCYNKEKHFEADSQVHIEELRLDNNQYKSLMMLSSSVMDPSLATIAP